MSAELVKRLRQLKWMLNCEMRGLIEDTTAYEAADTIETQAAEIKRLRGVLDALLQHDASSFFGADREKNQRASYRGVIRKAKKARAALGEPTGE